MVCIHLQPQLQFKFIFSQSERVIYSSVCINAKGSSTSITKKYRIDIPKQQSNNSLLVILENIRETICKNTKKNIFLPSFNSKWPKVSY